jgi:hypothetical protein
MTVEYVVCLQGAITMNHHDMHKIFIFRLQISLLFSIHLEFSSLVKERKRRSVGKRVQREAQKHFAAYYYEQKKFCSLNECLFHNNKYCQFIPT